MAILFNEEIQKKSINKCTIQIDNIISLEIFHLTKYLSHFQICIQMNENSFITNM